MIDREFIKIGAIVRLDTSDGWGREAEAIVGKCYRVVDNTSEFYFSGDTVNVDAVYYNPKDFTLVAEVELPLRNVYDIARPILAERKVGKVPMHMVVDGFPSALREVAKVMDWAAKVKGYKLHDWRNLPDADVEFPSAGYRHMFDNSEMKAQGLPALERVDHESHLVHLAHECFNKLAELELVLAGKIK